MLIFWRLLLGHLLADFTFQTNFINHWKRTSFLGMLVHCATHPLCYIVLTWPYLRDIWISTPVFQLEGWACILIVFVVHFIEDEWRVFTIFKHNVPDNTLYFLWDQIIHYAVIFAVIPVGLNGSAAGLFPEHWPVLGCLFVVATHAATIMIYFIEKDFYGIDFPDFEGKYLGMAERLVLALLFLIPANGWIVAAPAWLGVMYFARAWRMLDFSWFSYYFGASLSISCGLFARYLYYS